MTNSKMTKRALLTSVMALILCFAMLTGTTFAWFTDQETSANNKIIAGNLDVEMYNALDAADDNYLIGTGTKLFDGIEYWEPGAVAYENVTVVNKGNLALKYQLSLNFTDNGLADALKVAVVDDGITTTDRDALISNISAGNKWQALETFTLGGELYVAGNTEGNDVSATYGIVIYWQPSDNDNAYNSINREYSVDFGLTLVATQLVAESDAFGTDYDKPSVFPGNSSNAPLSGEELILKTEGKNYSTIVLSTDLVNALSNDATDVSIEADIPVVSEDANGNISVSYSYFELVDEDGAKIDLSNNTVVIPVKLYVGVEYAGKNATVSHDGVVVANATVDVDGYICYNTTHFCAINIVLADEAPNDSITDVKDADATDLTKLVQVRVGNHYYTVSQGMANSWTILSNAEQIVADIYVPEDLIAYAMMSNNGDITMNSGVHSDLTIKNDLDYSEYKWLPIGRFFTNIHGNNKTISNLSNSFFGCVYDCQMDNITIKNVTAAGSVAGVLGKELAGDIYFTNVTIAGENTVTYVNDGATNWPEGGTGVGAICGISLIGCGGHGSLDVTVTGTITVNYNDVAFGNTTKLENIGVSTEFGLNMYKENANATVTVVEGGAIVTNGAGHLYSVEIAEGFMQDEFNDAYYAVLSAEGLRNFAAYVNNGNQMEGCTVALLDNVDLENKSWTPIASASNPFRGVFDGQNHTISNLYIEAIEDDCVALFGFIDKKTTIKNFTIKNVNAHGLQRVAAVVGATNPSAVIDNVHVKGDIKIVAEKYYAAGIVTHGYVNVKNCSVIADGIGIIDGAGGMVGGICGWRGEGNTVLTNCHVKNIDMIGRASIGGLAALIHYNNTISDCSVENVTLTKTRVDGWGSIGALCGNWGGVSGTAVYTVTNNTIKNVTLNGTAIKIFSEIYGSKYSAPEADMPLVESGNTFENIKSNLSLVIAVSDAEALKTAITNAKDGDVIAIMSDITVADKWDNRYGGKTDKAITIDGCGNTLKFTGEVNDGLNYHAVFRFTGAAVVKNLTFDFSEAVAGTYLRAISAASDLIVDNCTFIGSDDYTKDNAVMFGDINASAQIDASVSITNCTFTNWRRGVSDNENAKEVKSVVVSGNTFNSADAYISVYGDVTFTDNVMDRSLVNITSYTNAANAKVVVTGNTLDADYAEQNVIGSATKVFGLANVVAQEGMTVSAQ